jgi:hypothetical protein
LARCSPTLLTGNRRRGLSRRGAFGAFALAASAAAWGQLVDVRAVPTYESVGLYWSNPAATVSGGCEVRFRRVGDTAWKQGLDMWFDSRGNECRGSLLNLWPATSYEAQMNLPGQPVARTLTFTTWSNQKPVAATVTVPSGSATLVITQGGSPSGYVVYQGAPGAVLDGGNVSQYNVEINASFVILRGLVLRGARQDAIRISGSVSDVIVEDNEITGWGRLRPGTTWGMDLDAAIRADCRNVTTPLERVTIQRNEIHTPRYGANSWSDGHPAGPQAVTFSFCGGNHVIRHNEIWSAAGHYYNDVIGGEDNISTTGFPNTDSDIYGNDLSNAWDDAIEAEGGNRNGRIWGNYMDNTATGIATTVTAVGPVYIWRNVYNRSRFLEKVPLDQDERQEMFKAGSDASLGDGRRFILHNTTLQAIDPSAAFSLGTGNGIVGTGNSQRVKNTISRNNIFHLWKPTASVFYQTGNGFESTNDMTNGDISAVPMVNPILAAPTYAAGNGWQSESGGHYALAPWTPGYDGGVRIANVNDDFIGAAPDVGAHEAGSPALKFGIAASAGSSISPPPPRALLSVGSSKVHGAAGTFTLGLARDQPIDGAVSVEPRQIGSGHKLIFQFDGPIGSPGTVACVDAMGAPIGSATASAAGSTVEVTLAVIPDGNRVTVSLSNVDGAGVNASISLGFLVGDVSGSRGVTAADIDRVKGRVGQPVTYSTFLHDVDANGAIDATDTIMVKQRSGLAI